MLAQMGTEASSCENAQAILQAELIYVGHVVKGGGGLDLIDRIRGDVAGSLGMKRWTRLTGWDDDWEWGVKVGICLVNQYMVVYAV